MNIHLQSKHTKHLISSPFKHATNGQDADFFTEVEVAYDEDYLKISFVCHDNPYTLENSMKQHNEPLYNQEVFEVFIGEGKEDTRNYLEIEINPNNALWMGKIANPDLGESLQCILELVNPQEAGILHDVSISENTWSGYLQLPWDFIGRDTLGNYRINFYRIRSRVSHLNRDWECDTDSCDFVCWQSTLSGEEPAFHRPKRFGHLLLA